MRSFVILSLAVLALAGANHGYTIKSRVVKGQQAGPGQFPFFSYLNIKLSDPTKASGCGAALISDEWLVTAAHCLKDSIGLFAHLGEYQFNRPEPEHTAIFVDVDDMHPHPEYNSRFALNDIALLRLSEKVKLSKNIQPVSLPQKCESPVGLDVIAMGHGKTSNNGGVSLRLNYAQLKTLPLQSCSKLFPIFNYFDSYVCVQAENNGFQSVCSGDSGGPLVTMSNNTLIGVADFVTIAGCETGAPQGFTNVYSYLGWISEVTGLTLPQC